MQLRPIRATHENRHPRPLPDVPESRNEDVQTSIEQIS